MKRKYIKEKFQMVTQKPDFIPLNPLIPSNFSKKSPMEDLPSNKFQKLK
jgi:hypothetical protein